MGKFTLKPVPTGEDEESSQLSKTGLISLDGDLVIDGRPLTIAQVGKPEIGFAPTRLWDKVDQASLPADIRQTFVHAATSLVLSKNNKLSTPKVAAANDKFLGCVLNLQSQLKTIRAHLITYNIFDVMTIVILINVKEQAGIK